MTLFDETKKKPLEKKKSDETKTKPSDLNKWGFDKDRLLSQNSTQQSLKNEQSQPSGYQYGNN